MGQKYPIGCCNMMSNMIRYKRVINMSNLKRKKLSFAILDILRKYTDEDHRLSQKDIIDILKTEYDMTADRKSIKRNITSLMEMGYEINFSEALRMFPNKNGVLEESYINTSTTLNLGTEFPLTVAEGCVFVMEINS